MDDKKFNFIQFINEKGFENVNLNKFIFEYSDEYHVLLRIEDGDYIIPFGLSERFKNKIPDNLHEAEKQFNTIADILKINYK
ncbi:hypothetical protein [Chryseobacterium sp. CFS15]|uniref:hypothetical protein n=1 Tax=Chryseobacterium sp. CFS15 TaxID=2986946 RepID=UPI0028085EBD|nr:hypothetical protein [Chryseobacterium sp. CFS15]MDQ8141654.1 hypothetical protein [Chryseobacterium sp. CFS15]